MEFSGLFIPTPVALALIAVLGYAFGRRSRQPVVGDAEQAARDLKRAQHVANELEVIAEAVRKNLATHQGAIAKFKERVQDLTTQDREAAWQDLCKEAEQMLKPTLRLAAQMAHAYDEIRQQSNHLMAFTEVRTDALTKVSNRRALDETLDTSFAMMHRYEQKFSIAIFDIDHFKRVNDEKGHLYGDKMLQMVARLIDENVRDTDVAARYGGEEFVVVMPHTPLEGACIFADRLRQTIEQAVRMTISGGVAAVKAGDNPQSLLSRADAALYSAKAAGRNCIYFHNGEEIESVAAVDSPLVAVD